jgi:membrane protease YdiL (CAAX protease family)
MADPKRRHMFDDPKNVKRVIYALYTACAVSVIAEFFIHPHVVHPWEALFGFYAIYGFVACVLLVLIAKELRKVLMRREDYYDR